MTNDAKLGLVVGIGIVILIAIVFYRKEPALAQALPDANAPAQVQSASIVSIPTAVEPVTPTAPTPPAPIPEEPESPAPAAPRTRSR
jgi:hypothetical protein